MSALGQKQTFELEPAMSALPPKADIRPGAQNVRLVPIADIQRSIEALADWLQKAEKRKTLVR
jgi:hypothetical protein